MFRIRATYYKDMDMVILNCTNKMQKRVKYARITNFSEDYNLYTFTIKCRELMRDMLYAKYGNRYRRFEDVNRIAESIGSTARRMQTKGAK